MVKEKKIDFCVECRKDTTYHMQTAALHKTIKDKEYEFEVIEAVCDICGENIDLPGLADFNIKKMDAQYRRLEGLISIEDIQKMMEIYQLGKAPLSLALGFGEITITRYLLGQIPSKEYSNIMKKALSSPEYMIRLLHENAAKLGDASYKKSLQAAEKIAGLFCLSDKMLLTISYIFEQMQEVTPLALQKLLYFIQGIYLVSYGKPLYKEDCMAWVHGPVYENVYDLFRDFKYNPIDDNRFVIFKSRFDELTDQEKNVIDLVVNSFGSYSGKVLEKITHSEAPWISARIDYEPLQSSRELIEKDSIRQYFKKVSETYGIETVESLNRYIQSYL